MLTHDSAPKSTANCRHAPATATTAVGAAACTERRIRAHRIESVWRLKCWMLRARVRQSVMEMRVSVKAAEI